MAIVGDTVYQCRDGYRMFAENEDGSYASYGVYFGPPSEPPVGMGGGDDRNRKPIRFACLKEQP